MKKLLLITALLMPFSVFAGETAVVYFSATGNTERVAQTIADELDADIFSISAAVPYSNRDLNWRDESSRVWDEHRAYPDARPEMAESIDVSKYDTIFLGYPIWWGEAPSIILTFLESTDLSGKTVIPFATSSSSGIGESDVNLHRYQPDANWQSGERFPSRVSDGDVRNWIRNLGL